MRNELHANQEGGGSMNKRYVTKVVIHDDGSKTVHMYPMSESCCSCGTLVQAILSECVRLILVIGLCLSVYNLSTGMKASSLLELSKRTDECKTAFGVLTNNITGVAQNLQVVNRTIESLNDEITIIGSVLKTSSSAAETLDGGVKATDERMKCVEWTITNCAPHQLKRCCCPCFW